MIMTIYYHPGYNCSFLQGCQSEHCKFSDWNPYTLKLIPLLVYDPGKPIEHIIQAFLYESRASFKKSTTLLGCNIIILWWHREIGCVLVHVFWLYPYMAGGVRDLSGVSLARALIPFMRTLPSWPNKFPKAPLPNVITLGVMNFNI